MTHKLDTDSACLCESCLQSCWLSKKQGYDKCKECRE